MAIFSTGPSRRGPMGNTSLSNELDGLARGGIAWSDASLIDAMRQGDHAALRAFVDRFRPVLETYARKTRIPKWEWPSCVTELLDDEAMRFAGSTTPPPANLGAYLRRAVANRYLQGKRSGTSRDRRELSASEERRGERVVPSSCSDFSLRASAGPDDGSPPLSIAVGELVAALRAELSPDDDRLLSWLSEGVPNRIIAEWLGVSPAAAGKRVWRLRKKLQGRAAARIAASGEPERRVLEGMLRRAGVTFSRSN